MDLVFLLKKRRNSIALKVILLLLFTISNISVNTLNAQIDPALSKALQISLDSLRNKYNIPGVSASVILPDNNVWIGASGMSNPASKDTLKTNMLMSIGSITKTFTCTIILQLASENKLSLEDSLYKWLPKIKNIDSTITIRQLLNHTSGIYNFTDNNLFGNNILANPAKRLSPEDVFSYVNTPMFKAGRNFSYSNTNYYLLGLIIEKVTGSKFSAELNKRLLTSFSLSSTFLDTEDTLKNKLAAGWSDLNKDGKLDNVEGYSRIGWYSALWSAGAMVSSASDIASWVKYLYGGEVVEKKYFDQMINFTSLSGGLYGLGTMKTTVLQKEFWGHGGTTPGYTSYACYCRQNNISIAVIVNRDNFMPQNLLPGLLKTIINYLPTSTKEEVSLKPEKPCLVQNFPNPFNPETNIVYELPAACHVELKVFNILGYEVSTLVSRQQNAGHYLVKFNGSDLSSGIYFYRLKAGTSVHTRKMLLIK